jgi:hypothetical protein
MDPISFPGTAKKTNDHLDVPISTVIIGQGC